MLATQQYDVDAPEGAQKSSAYFTKKDLKWVALVIIIGGLLFFPLWQVYKQQRDKQVCATNMKGIYEAMMLYADSWDSRLPPLYDKDESGAPALFEDKPVVWASRIIGYLNPRTSLSCPQAHDSEKMKGYGYDIDKDRRADFELTYGMFLPMGAFPYQLAENASNTALLLETSNNGALGSYNPTPFRNAEGDVVPFDAFMVGFDDSNDALTNNSKAVTRLAFRDVAAGYNSKTASSRHKEGIHVIFLDGHKGYMKPPSAVIKNLYPDAEGPWRTR